MDGGGLTRVERRGDTVLREAGEWTPTVHALLRHLQDVGFPGAPGPLGRWPRMQRLRFVKVA